ncbi:hypothetical protein CEXT_161001 [Caerostris extrusa]|uniref:Uncharacterized protein n=1 Tax=Caerostris extrusa TaxID=172846 RepID=A0AAV4WBK8_CAEEX|nr:hypothetical protein CEXT_161001 [Caerostris extrusa]
MDLGECVARTLPLLFPRFESEVCVHNHLTNPVIVQRKREERGLPFLKINIPCLIFSGNRGRGNLLPPPITRRKIQSPSPITYSISFCGLNEFRVLPGRASKRTPLPTSFSYAL